MVFNLVFANNTILSCFFFFILIIDLHFLIPAVTAQIVELTAEPTIPTETTTNEANVETKTRALTTETKTRKFSK